MSLSTQSIASARLKVALEQSISKTVTGERVAVAFSGGVDSVLIAAIAKKYADSVTLYTAGIPGCKDVASAESSAKALDMEWIHIPMNEKTVERNMCLSLKVTPSLDPVTISFELPLAHVLECCKEEKILTGQGADEFFAGYSKYEGISVEEFTAMRLKDIEKLKSYTSVHEDRIAKNYSKIIIRPFMDSEIMDIVDSIPVIELMPKNGNRKHVIREVAMDVCPFAADRKKIAAQYGSGSLEIMKSIAKRKDQSISELIIWLRNGDVRE